MGPTTTPAGGEVEVAPVPLTLHAQHAAAGASFLVLRGREVVRSYGAPEAEHAAVRQAAGLLDDSAREVLRVTGEDRSSFLHGMITNDVNKLPEGRATYAAMLTPKGAMVADLRLWKRPGELLLDVEPGLGATVKAFLEKYLISEDAEITDVTSQWALLWLAGPATPGLLGAGPPPGANEAAERKLGGVDVVVLGSPLIHRAGVELLVPRAALAAVHAGLLESEGGAGLRQIGFEAHEALRVEAGVPRFGQDMDETTIPMEANLKHAIDYQKGCYIGQEVIARGTFRGHMNRNLMGLVFGATPPPLGAELRRGEKKVGKVTSALSIPGRAEAIGLGYVHRDHQEPGIRLEVVGYAEGATVHALPFVAP